MIDKVRLRDYYNSYQPGHIKKAETTDDVFPLADKGSGVIYEPSGKQLEKKTLAAVKTQQPEQKSTAKESPKQGENHTASSSTDVIASAKTVLVKILDTVKQFFLSVWNGDAKPTEAENDANVTEIVPDGEQSDETNLLQQATEPEDAKDLSEDVKTAKTDRAQTVGGVPDDLIRRHDLEGLERLLTKEGTRKPARNTDLLTFYNRYGKIVSMNASDKRKILQGNYNDIKL